MSRSGTFSVFRSAWMITAVILIASVLVLTNWYYYRITKQRLEEEFGARLESVASLAAANLDIEEIESQVDGSSGALIDDDIPQMRTIWERYSLADILLVREDGTIIFSLNSDIIIPGDRYPMWNMDYPAIIKALEGRPASTDLYRSGAGDYMMAGYAPVSRGGDPSELVVTVEASPTFLRGLKELRTVLGVITIVYAAGIILFIIFVLKAAGSLIKAREWLMRSETLSSMGRMAAGIAHEIRNPLFIIRSGAEKLKEAVPEKRDEIDTFIIEEVDRLDKTLSAYLAFSTERDIEKEMVDLAAILDKSVKLVEKSIGRDEVLVKTSLYSGGTPFTGEENKLLQAFMNILVNSYQAIDERGEIEVRLSLIDGWYRIIISDNGSGIPQKKISRVFEPFYTSKQIGSGLGLSIVKKIVEAHFGRISIDSDGRTGTTVTIDLPLDHSEFGDGDE